MVNNFAWIYKDDTEEPPISTISQPSFNHYPQCITTMNHHRDWSSFCQMICSRELMSTSGIIWCFMVKPQIQLTLTHHQPWKLGFPCHLFRERCWPECLLMLIDAELQRRPINSNKKNQNLECGACARKYLQLLGSFGIATLRCWSPGRGWPSLAIAAKVTGRQPQGRIGVDDRGLNGTEY